MYRWTKLVQLSYTTYISVDLAHHKIVCAKVGKGDIICISVSEVCFNLSK